jgi:hypothetical protein
MSEKSVTGFLAKHAEERRQEHDSHIRPEIAALIARGNITLTELNELRCNSWEWQAMVPAMNDEAFVDRMEYALKNCFTSARRPFSTYNEAVEGLWAPELIRRYKMISKKVSDLAEEFFDAKSLHEKFLEATNKWQGYERDYILPCFKWAKEEGFELEPLVLDNPGKNCVEIFFNRLRGAAHEARNYAETLDAVREALGQKETHYLCIPDDVGIAIKALEWYATQAQVEKFRLLRTDESLHARVALALIRGNADRAPCEACKKMLIVVHDDRVPAIFCAECGGGCEALPVEEALPSHKKVTP